MPRVFIIIPAHNRRETTLACLACLTAQRFDHYRIVVVDDGSMDGTGGAIAERFPAVKILTGDGNLWWTGAMNLGVRWVLQDANDDDYILSLNDDVSFEPDYVESLVKAAQVHPGCMIGSVALDERGSHVADAGVRINWLTAKYTRIGGGRPYADLVKNDGDTWPVDVLPGRGTLIPVGLFRRVGLYNDQRLPHYGADYEFSRRAVKNGYRLLMSAESVLCSQTSATGMNNRMQSLTWKQLGKSFFMRRSSNCIRYRFNFARLAVPPHLFMPYLILDLCRLCVGNIRAQLLKNKAIE